MPDVVNHSAVSQSIGKTVLYYDIFQYPLKAEEIYRYLDTDHTNLFQVYKELNNLTEQGLLFRFGDFYSPQNNESLVERRLRGNQRAAISMEIAKRQAKLIGSFPFVKSVMVSGSLSKGYMDENSDLDFFIITSPRRLWLARTLLVIYKRIFLFNSHKNFCVNYFIDAEHLEIEEKNLFTATELCTLIPLYGIEQFELFHKHNQWVKTTFPNYHYQTPAWLSFRDPFGKSLLEKIFENSFGNWIESQCHRLTLNRWKKLYEDRYSEKDFAIAFKSKEHVSKNHPNNYQRRVMELFKSRMTEFMAKHELSWYE